MSNWFLNGVEADEIGIDSRGLQYGDGLFETIAIRNGSARLWEYHVDRLEDGCERLGLDIPDMHQCRTQIESQAPEYGTAKIVVAGRAGQRGYGRASRNIDVLIRVFESQPLPANCYRDGVQTIVCDTRLATGSVTAGVKTLNRLEQVLARNEVIAAKAFEGIVCDTDGNVICGTMSNVFAAKNNRVVTPRLDRCGVAGVMRRKVIETIRDAGYSVEQAVLESLEGVNEVFLTNSQFGVLPVSVCGDVGWPIGDITLEASRLLAESGVVECGE